MPCFCWKQEKTVVVRSTSVSPMSNATPLKTTSSLMVDHQHSNGLPIKHSMKTTSSLMVDHQYTNNGSPIKHPMKTNSFLMVDHHQVSDTPEQVGLLAAGEEVGLTVFCSWSWQSCCNFEN